MSAPGRLVFVSAFDEQMASHRFRVRKLVPELRARGLEVEVVGLPRPRAAWRLLRGLRRRGPTRPVVVFQKTVQPALARLARSMGARLVLDLDDGGDERIDGRPVPEAERRSLRDFVRRMDATVVSVEALARWLSGASRRTFVVPTCLDVEAYAGLPAPSDAGCVIGWVGGPMARVVLPPLAGPLAAVCRATGARLRVVGAGDPGLPPELPLCFERWRLEREPAVFGELDVGIMPLPHNQRAEMKAGFKLLQYMAAGRPVVATPIGVNREIVREGVNGYLADTPAEWERALGRLAGDAAHRRALGRNGRALVRERFPLGRAAEAWLEVVAALAADD